MTPRSRIPAPNYTQAPNVLLDELLPELGLAELKVTLVIVRSTIGWHEEEQKLSLSELERRTGLTRQGVLNGVRAGEARGTIERRVEGQKGAERVFYALNLASQRDGLGLVNDVDQDESTALTGAGQAGGPGPIEGKKSSKETSPGAPFASEGGLHAQWVKVMDDLRSSVTGVTFERWLSQLELVERDGDRLVLRAPDAAAAWIRERFVDLIEGAAARQGFGPAVTVEIVKSETELARERQEALGQRRPPWRRRPAA